MEILPGMPNRRKLRSKPVSYEKRAERLKEIKDQDEKEKQDSVRVAEKIIDNLEQIGIKCPRCSNKNVKEDLTLPKLPDKINLHCNDCNYRWQTAKT